MKKPNIIGTETLGREGSGIFMSREGTGYADDIRPGQDGIGGAISQEGIGLA